MQESQSAQLAQLE